jgi:hypothetical protein
MGVDADNSFLAKDISRIKAWESGNKLALFIHWLSSDSFRLLRGAADCPRRAVG